MINEFVGFWGTKKIHRYRCAWKTFSYLNREWASQVSCLKILKRITYNNGKTNYTKFWSILSNGVFILIYSVNVYKTFCLHRYWDEKLDLMTSPSIRLRWLADLANREIEFLATANGRRKTLLHCNDTTTMVNNNHSGK